MKKIIALFIAAAFVVGFSAFTVLSEKSTLPDPEFWFELDAGGTASNPLDYSLVGGTGENEPECDEVTGYRCAIKTEMQGAGDPNPGYPVIGTFSEERKRQTP